MNKHISIITTVLIGLLFTSSINVTLFNSPLKCKHPTNNYLYETSNDTLYICPIDTTILHSGLFEIRYNIFGYIKHYSLEGFSFKGTNLDEHWDYGKVLFHTNTFKPFTADEDTILYRSVREADFKVVLEKLTLHTDKFDVGGFRVGDSISVVESKLNIPQDSVYNSIVILTPFLLQYNDNLVDYIDSVGDVDAVMTYWSYFPEATCFNIRDNKIASIESFSYYDILSQYNPESIILY